MSSWHATHLSMVIELRFNSREGIHDSGPANANGICAKRMLRDSEVNPPRPSPAQGMTCDIPEPYGGTMTVDELIDQLRTAAAEHQVDHDVDVHFAICDETDLTVIEEVTVEPTTFVMINESVARGFVLVTLHNHGGDVVRWNGVTATLDEELQQLTARDE